MTGQISFEHAKLLARHALSRSAFYRSLAGGSPGARVIALDGVQSTIVPASPWFSLFNCVFSYESASALEAALPELEREYSRAGVHAWSVSVSEDDRPGRDLLELSGFVGGMRTTRMAAELAELDLEPRLELDLVSAPTWDDVARCNSRAYGIPERTIAAAFGSISDPAFNLHAVRVGGEVVAAMVTRDQSRDTYLSLVATVPGAQRAGVGAELVRHALRTAQVRGCRTGTGESTPLAVPLYIGLGIPALGALEQWERRAAA